jgi:hypothetical protein
VEPSPTGPGIGTCDVDIDLPEEQSDDSSEEAWVEILSPDEDVQENGAELPNGRQLLFQQLLVLRRRNKRTLKP